MNWRVLRDQGGREGERECASFCVYVCVCVSTFVALIFYCR